MRIVLDTNVVLSALLWTGTPYQLLAAIRELPQGQLYSSTPLLDELADVLTRPAATKRLALIAKTAPQLLTDYIAITEWVNPVAVPRIAPNDPDDDQVIACALAARADFIVSGNQDLLILKAYQNIPIITAAQALQIVQKQR